MTLGIHLQLIETVLDRLLISIGICGKNSISALQHSDIIETKKCC